MTIPFYNERPPEYWLRVLQNAHQGLMTASDHAGRSEALQAIQAANNALSSYDQDRVDSSRFSSIPQETAAIGQGVGAGAKGIFTGIGKIASDLYHLHPVDAGMDVVKGVVGTGRNIAGIVDAATDPDMPETERVDRIRGASSTLPGLSLGTRPVQNAIGAGIRALTGNKVPALATAASESAPIDPNVIDFGKGGSPPPEPTPTSPIDLPKGGPTVPGYTPNGPAAAAPVPMESALEQLAKGLTGANRPAGFTPTEGAPEPGPASPFGAPTAGSKFTNPEPVGNVATEGARAGQPQGISVEGPPMPKVPENGYPPTLAEMHGRTGTGSSFLKGVNAAEPNAPGFFDETALPAKPVRFIGPTEPISSINSYLDQIAKASEGGYPELRAGEAGFMNPSLLRVMIGLPIGARILKAMNTTPDAVVSNPGIAAKFMTAMKNGGLAAAGSMGPATDSTGIGIGHGNQ